MDEYDQNVLCEIWRVYKNKGKKDLGLRQRMWTAFLYDVTDQQGLNSATFIVVQYSLSISRAYIV